MFLWWAQVPLWCDICVQINPNFNPAYWRGAYFLKLPVYATERNEEVSALNSYPNQQNHKDINPNEPVMSQKSNTYPDSPVALATVL